MCFLLLVHTHLTYTSFSSSPSNTADFPESAWGLKLGDMKEAIKRGHSYKDHRDELVELGFPFERTKNTTGWPRLKGIPTYPNYQP